MFWHSWVWKCKCFLKVLPTADSIVSLSCCFIWHWPWKVRSLIASTFTMAFNRHLWMSCRRRLFEAEVEGYIEPPDTSPTFTFPLRDRFIQEGVGVKLITSVKGKPPPKVTWYKEGTQLKPGSKYDLVLSLGICSLEISACEMEDAGRYTCKAENDKGEEETSCKVTVNG